MTRLPMLLLIPVLCSALTTLTGCSLRPSPLGPQLTAAAAETGKARAGVTLPAMPAGCYQPTPHAGLAAGDSKTGALARERAQLDRANADKGWCKAGFYDPLRARLAKPGAGR